MSGFAGYNHVGLKTRLRTFERETPSRKQRTAAKLAAERLTMRAEQIAAAERLKEEARERRRAEVEAARPVNRVIAKVKGFFRKVIGR